MALGVAGLRPILQRGQVADDDGRRQSVGRDGGEEVAQVGEEPNGSRVVRFDDAPGEGAGGGPGELGPRPAGLVRDGEEGAPVISLAVIKRLGDGGQWL